MPKIYLEDDFSQYLNRQIASDDKPEKKAVAIEDLLFFRFFMDKIEEIPLLSPSASVDNYLKKYIAKMGNVEIC